MEVICAWCLNNTVRTYRVVDEHGNEEQVCVSCKHDVEYCESGGRIPQEPNNG